METPTYSFRIPLDLKERLDRATDQTVNPMAPQKTVVLRHGLDLALKELEGAAAKSSNKGRRA